MAWFHSTQNFPVLQKISRNGRLSTTSQIQMPTRWDAVDSSLCGGGPLLDRVEWYVITPELIASQITERCRLKTIAFCQGGDASASLRLAMRRGYGSRGTLRPSTASPIEPSLCLEILLSLRKRCPGRVGQGGRESLRQPKYDRGYRALVSSCGSPLWSPGRCHACEAITLHVSQ